MKVKFSKENFYVEKELDAAQLIALYNSNEIQIIEYTSKVPPSGLTKNVKIRETVYQVNDIQDYPVLNVFFEDK